MRAAYETHRAHGFEVLSISIQEADDVVDAFIAKYGLDYQFLMDRTGQVSATYEVPTTPMTYFIAPDGTITDSLAGVVSQSWLQRNINKNIPG